MGEEGWGWEGLHHEVDRIVQMTESIAGSQKSPSLVLMASLTTRPCRKLGLAFVSGRAVIGQTGYISNLGPQALTMEEKTSARPEFFRRKDT